jgi:hypothetical protein
MPSDPTEQTSEAGQPQRVGVVVAYEDYEAGKRAQRTCKQLLQLGHLDTAPSADLWKFDMFKFRAMREAAVEETAGADLLVVALLGGTELPSGVREWVHESLQHPSRPKALLVLAGPVLKDEEITPPAELELERVASKARCPYWCLHLEPPEGAWSDPAYPIADLEGVAQALRPRSPIAFTSSLPAFLAKRDQR